MQMTDVLQPTTTIYTWQFTRNNNVDFGYLFGSGGRHATAPFTVAVCSNFWIDPESPYHKPIFAEDKRFVFFCADGWLGTGRANRARMGAASATKRGKKANGPTVLQPAMQETA